jgi:thiamine biosynthesis protein ThiS
MPQDPRSPAPDGAAPLVVFVNGERREVPAGATARDLVVMLGLEGRPLAVEVNERVVPRAGLAECRLRESDRLEFVTLVGGG